MADSKITALAALTAADPVNDMFPVVDVSDTSMAASGTTKRISVNNILSSSPTASGALTVTGLVTAGSATITGAATVGTTLGVTGVSTFAAGTAALPALTTTGDTNTGIYYPAADTFAVTTGGTERYRVDSAGNLGIGVTPSAWSATFKSLDIGSGTLTSQSSQQTIGLYANAFENGTNYTRKALGFAAGYNIYNGAHYWLNAASGAAASTFAFGDAKMTLDASGNLLLGKTVSGAFTDGCQLFPAGTISLGHVTGTGSGAAYSIFAYNSIKTGDITQNGTTGVLYNTVSDYRLKESVQPIANGLARVSALKPSIYKWKSDGSSGEGFLAHELAEVVPFAVTGDKDALNEDGSVKAQSVDMSRVVPILVAAIKELTARVQTLEAK